MRLPRLTGGKANFGVLRHHAALEKQHLAEGIFVTMVNLEVIEMHPELRVHSWVAELGRVSHHSSGSIDLAQPLLQVGILQACLPHMLAAQALDRPLEDLPRSRDAEELSTLFDRDLEHLPSPKSVRASVLVNLVLHCR